MGRQRRSSPRLSAQIKASVIRGSADQLLRRATWAYRAALLFFLMALAGPAVAATMLLTSTNPSWYFMLAGLSVSAVPFTIGAVLLRHHAKLNDQHREDLRSLGALERFEMALESMRTAPPHVYEAARQKAVEGLLSDRLAPALQEPTSATPAVVAGAGDIQTKDGGTLAGIQKTVDVTVEAVETAKDVMGAIISKKGG